MTVASPPQTAPSSSTAKMPGEVIRGLVSLWLIIHFLGIVLAIATRNDYSQSPAGGEMGRSVLLNRLRQVPPLEQYIYALWLDVPYSYHLANGSPLDGDFSLRLELSDADGKKIETLIWPSPDISFGERRERLARLAFRAANAAERGDSSMAAVIGKAVLTQTGAKELEFNVWRHQPLNLEDARSNDSAQRDPNHNRTFVRAYTAKVRLNLNGEAEVSVPQEARDVAAPNQPPANTTTPKENETKTSPTPRTTEGESTETPHTTRPAPRRQRADPLPRAENSKKPNAPPSLFRPSIPDDNSAPK